MIATNFCLNSAEARSKNCATFSSTSEEKAVRRRRLREKLTANWRAKARWTTRRRCTRDFASASAEKISAAIAGQQGRRRNRAKPGFEDCRDSDRVQYVLRDAGE